MKLVECVPNFSEGRNREKISAITKEIESTPQVNLLDVDPGESTNRTVVTFIGSPEGVKEAAFKAIKKAAEVLDMSKHKGAHGRIGATDVCPFVPVSGVTMEDCIQLAHELGERVAKELGIPVYLYEEAAQKPERKNLANIRTGEYEGLPDKFKEVKAVGWYIEDYEIAQISINFINYKITPPHVVFDETIKEAEKIGLRVTGSELVGLIPKEALLMAGRHYLAKQGKSPGVPEEDLIKTAVSSLGLDDVAPFDPQKKIIEYQFKEVESSLLDFNLREFANELSVDSPAPGGGSTAALCGALSASLSSMVSNLTVGKKEYKNVQKDVKEIAVKAQSLKDEFLRAVDLDTIAFNKLMEAYRLPKKTEEQKQERDQAVEEAVKEATMVPFGVLEKSIDALNLAREIALKGNKNSLSDAGVAGLTGQVAAEGAYYNIKINLPNLQDSEFKSKIKKQATSLKKKAVKLGDEVREIIEKELK